jgi:hypothetical protein
VFIIGNSKCLQRPRFFRAFGVRIIIEESKAKSWMKEFSMVLSSNSAMLEKRE